MAGEPVTRRFLGWLWAYLWPWLLGAAIVFALAALSTPRSGAAAPAGDSISAAPAQPQSGAPNDDAIPRTRRIEPATTPDPAQQAVAGAPPTPTAYGLGTVRHSSGSATFARRPAATPRPTPSPSPRPAGVPSPARAAFNGLHPIAESWRTTGTAAGVASNMGPAFPATYLALPIGPGYRVRICGPGGCVTRTSTDAGPALHMQRPPYNRVADLSVQDFERVCAVSWRMGLCQASVAIVGRS